MSVSRQTISKWEADEIIPELNKLVALSDIFSCKLDAMRIGWDFPFVPPEMQTRFGIHGYVAAYILPEGFETSCPGVEFADQKEADYAVITIYEPFTATIERIQNAYKKILAYLQANGFCEKPKEDILSCFEHVYEKQGITCMDVYIHVDSVTKTDSFTNFS
ncbi:MAG: helix-turn-helix domain-containing protein [Lachnospiraceae bacterium]|nr:helix-turn-helix domain-containing protein [Lachnospiraceae bacterium]